MNQHLYGTLEGFKYLFTPKPCLGAYVTMEASARGLLRHGTFDEYHTYYMDPVFQARSPDSLTRTCQENGKLKLSCVLFSADSYLDKVTVDDAKMKDYYDKHREEFKMPAKLNEVEGIVAPFEDVKDNIKGYLVASEARSMAIRSADEARKSTVALMEKDKSTFEDAAKAAGLKTVETGYFARSENLNDIGEAAPLCDAALKLKPGEISAPVETRKGAVIFRVAEVQKPDEEAFKKDKEDYSKRALDAKKMLFLEDWLRGLEAANKPDIDMKDYEKYYR